VTWEPTRRSTAAARRRAHPGDLDHISRATVPAWRRTRPGVVVGAGTSCQALMVMPTACRTRAAPCEVPTPRMVVAWDDGDTDRPRSRPVPRPGSGPDSEAVAPIAMPPSPLPERL
jgi:hypothetical protein